MRSSNCMAEESGFLAGRNGRIAWRRRAGAEPTVVWLGGFKSDMTGAKAEAISKWAAAERRAFLRFDYSGHGASEGRFDALTISDWLQDALDVIDGLTSEPLLLVGSSMGGWIAALAALRRKPRIMGIVFIAPAPDFTEDLMWASMTERQRDILLRDGRLVEPSPYSEEPTVITSGLIEDGRRHLILGGAIDIACPVRILQGMADPDVPWRHALRFAELLTTDDLEVTLIKSGDHRLSKPGEIETIIRLISSLGGSRSVRTAF
ncbi:MAG: alpha/beta hydrolase [Parvularculaceae bacterium]|nr:alpha/beta hydrolase [Parvularculaceae bacterium]